MPSVAASMESNAFLNIVKTENANKIDLRANTIAEHSDEEDKYGNDRDNSFKQNPFETSLNVSDKAL